MNNIISEIFIKNRILLRNLQTLDITEFSKKRAYSLFFGVDRNNFYTLIFFRNAKSKFLKKELNDLYEICKLVEIKFDTNIKKKVLFYKSQICSKILKDTKDWKFYAFM